MAVILVTAVAVTLPAGLGAATPVAGTTANGCRQLALAGIAHTKSAMAKHFNFNGGLLTNIPDLVPA